ncbi:unnamed protein product [Nyctereutes procyonoides]|uniref:(raccoon dog) hypothetical protein n=1 Tax=Nyctereutes procyonoides TaxID=34880 RepID=A0A811ZE94_NYCPR|nr:unnamed protein product [Nyctereutes procyonoides]
MLGPLAVLCALLFPGGGAGLKLEQTPVVVGRLGTSATLPCTVDSSVYYIHWYFHREGIAPRRLLYIHTYSSSVQRDASVNMDKVNAKMHKNSYNCNLLVQKLEKSDEGMYYCAAWEEHNKSASEDISPKPTVFLPSIAEIKVCKAGTYLYWKEKNNRTVLQSQHGSTMKPKDTYMKFIWLTVTGVSMDKEHKYSFPSINEDLVARMESYVDSKGHSEAKQNTEVVTVSPLSSRSFPPGASTVEPAAINSTEASLDDEYDPLQVQLMNTSAYYTYLLLLLMKSLTYSIITAICLLGGPAFSDEELRNSGVSTDSRAYSQDRGPGNSAGSLALLDAGASASQLPLAAPKGHG